MRSAPAAKVLLLAGSCLGGLAGAEKSVAGRKPLLDGGAKDASKPGASIEHPLDITADHLTILTKENRTKWTGHVRVVRPAENGQPPVDIRCDEMRTTATAQDAGPGAGGAQKVDKVICDGDVAIAQGDRSGTGEHAVFDNVAGIVTVTGGAKGARPRAQDGESRYSADLLTFLVDSNKLDMEGHVVAEVSAAKAGGSGTAHADGGSDTDGGRS